MGVKVTVFIHGLHENAHSWQEWIPYFENLGYECHAPNYPFHEGEAKSLRQSPYKELAKIRFRGVVEHPYKLHQPIANSVTHINRSFYGWAYSSKTFRSRKRLTWVIRFVVEAKSGFSMPFAIRFLSKNQMRYTKERLF